MRLELLRHMAKDRTNPTSDVLNPNGMYEESTKLSRYAKRSYSSKIFDTWKRVQNYRSS